MDSTFVQYLIFILAALLVIWAVIVINARLARRSLSDETVLKNWVDLDTRRSVTREDSEDELTLGAEKNEEVHDLYMRAHQNGHHIEKQSPPL